MMAVQAKYAREGVGLGNGSLLRRPRSRLRMAITGSLVQDLLRSARDGPEIRMGGALGGSP